MSEPRAIAEIDACPRSCMFRSVFFQIYLAALAFWLYHKILRVFDVELGAVRQAVPLYGTVRDLHLRDWLHLGFSAILPVVLAAVAVLVVRFLLSRPRTNWLLAACVAAGLAFAVNLGVAHMHGGFRGIANEYVPNLYSYAGDLSRVQSVRQFLHDYVAIAPTLSLHAATHPPGGVLFLHCVTRMLGERPMAMALAVTAMSCLNVAMIYLLARSLYGGAVGLVAIGLAVVTPNLVLFGSGTIDGLFAFFLILSIYCFHRALLGRWWPWAIGMGLALAGGFVMTFSTACMGILFAVYLALAWWTGQRLMRVLLTLVTGAATFVLFFGLLYTATGFNLIASVTFAIDNNTRVMGKARTIGQFLNVGVGNLFAFLIGVGIPLIVLWLRRVARSAGEARREKRWDVFELGFAISLLLVSFSTLFTMEVERIWIFFSPFVVIAAARHVAADQQATGRWTQLYWVAGLTLAQTLVMRAVIST